MADDTDEKPTDEQVAEARAVLAKAAIGTDTSTDKMIELVMLPAFDETYDAMVAAQSVNPANTELSYAISMMSRLKANFLPR